MTRFAAGQGSALAIRRAASAASLILAATSLNAGATSPAAITITEADRDVPKTATGGPFLFPNESYTAAFVEAQADAVLGIPGGPAVFGANGNEFTCDPAGTPGINPCDVVDLTVNLPADYATKHPTDKVRITLSWVAQESDIDLHVYEPPYDTAAGHYYMQSRNNPPLPEVVELPVRSGSSSYRIFGVPAAPVAISTTISIVLASGAEPLGPTSVTLGGPTYANYLPAAALSSYSNNAGEPTIGVDLGTNKAYMMFRLDTLEASFDDSSAPASVTWKNLGPMGAPTTADPFLTMDQHRLPDGSANHRIWIAQLLAANSYMAYTEPDCPLIWTDTARQTRFCRSTGAGYVHGADNQSIAVGPYPNNAKPLTARPGATYPHAMYYCSHADVNAFCSRSDDGGQTFNPSRPIFGATDLCGNHGHVKVGADGTVYVPMNNTCQGHEGVTVSVDAGETFHYLTVPGTVSGRWDPSIAISNDGLTVWFAYAEQGDDRPMVIKGTLDKSDVNNPVIHWIEPATDVGAPAGIRNIAFSAAVAGDKDRAAYAFLGTTATGNSGDVDTFDPNAPWYLWIASTFDGGRTWQLRNATPDDPVQRGVICDGGFGSACESAGTRNLLDFMDADIDGEGRVLVGYADGCVGATCIAGNGAEHSVKGTIARQVTGKRMLAAFDPPDANGPPDAPVLGATRNAYGVHLAWTTPASAAAITGFEVDRSIDGGAFTKIVTLAAAATKYSDRAAVDAAKTYTYRVRAVSSLGTSVNSNLVAPALPVESACTLPGLTIFTDGSGDQTGSQAGANSQLDVESLRIGEPFTTVTDDSLTFTLKVANLAAPVLPNGTWKVSFDVPDTSGTARTLFVSMDTGEASGQWKPVFGYGWTDTSGAQGSDNSQDNSTTALVTGSYGADGTIVIKLKTNRVMALNDSLQGTHVFDVNIRKDTVLSNVKAATQVMIGAVVFGAGGGELISTDQAGSGGYTAIGNFACRPNTAPTLVVAASPATGPGPLDVRFDASGSSDSDPGDTVNNFVFDFGDGSPVLSSSNPVVTHTYRDPGTYGATIRAQDSRGLVSTAANRQIVVNADNSAPTATLSIPSGPFYSGQPVTFTVGGTDPDAGDTLAYDLDFGDGTAHATAAGTVAHSYAAGGSYVATLVVTDAHAASAQAQVSLDVIQQTLDTVPDPVTFVVRNNVVTNVFVTSETKALSGFNTAVPVAISTNNSSQYSLNGGAWTSAGGTAQPGDTIAVRHLSASSASTQVDTTLTVGGMTAVFTSVTTAQDKTPDAFTFGTKTGVDPGAVVESDPVTLTGYNAPISLVAGPGLGYSIEGGAWTSAGGTLSPGQSIRVRHTATTTSMGYTKTYLKAGGVTGYFTTRTK